MLYDHEQDALSRVADWGGDEVFAAVPRRRFTRAERPVRRGGHAPERVAVVELEESEPVAAAPVTPAPEAAPEPAGRRTVVVTGRPEKLPVRTERRRPPRTLDERISGRPDRVAGWACGLGLLLILVAVSTADAAPL